jgi:hypothetical protein
VENPVNRNSHRPPSLRREGVHLYPPTPLSLEGEGGKGGVGEPTEGRVGGGTPRDTFVVRIWSSDGSDGMRGQVQHVRTRKRAYFATRQRLLTFIQEHLSESPQCPS